NGFSAFNGTHTIRLNGGTGTVVWGGADFNITTLQFNTFNSNALVDFQNGLDINTPATTARFITVRKNLNSTTDFARISGVISNSQGAGPLVFGGNSTLELTAANTYTGPTVLNDASIIPNTVVKLVGTGSIASSSAIDIGSLRTLDGTALTGGANFSIPNNRFAIAPGQTLGGTGTLQGNVFVGSAATIRGGSPATLLNNPTGQLLVNGGVRFGGGTLAVDLNGTATSGATVSRLALNGPENEFDIALANGPMTIQLLNTQGLVQNQTYSFIIASSSSDYTRDGIAVSSYNFGTDFTLSGGNFPSFAGVSLSVSGSNLVLQFTPVPEPSTVGLLAMLGFGVMRKLRSRFHRKIGLDRTEPK
ncbi:MAG: PEP-CTERM sorting domain-containing protein, partial [Gemmataceae bacterium]